MGGATTTTRTEGRRTARVELRGDAAQRQRCFGLLRSGGDLWAAVLELNALRRRRGAAPVVGYAALCRELARAEPGGAGELSSTGARTIRGRRDPRTNSRA